jgi:capsid protein
MEALQWQLLVPGLCRPVWQRFVAMVQAIGALPEGAIDAEWTAPRFEAVDPLKDIQADILAVRAGLVILNRSAAAVRRSAYR